MTQPPPPVVFQSAPPLQTAAMCFPPGTSAVTLVSANPAGPPDTAQAPPPAAQRPLCLPRSGFRDPVFPPSTRSHLRRFTLTSGALRPGWDPPPRLAPLGPAWLRSALTRFATSQRADLNWRGQNFLERNDCRLNFAPSPGGRGVWGGGAHQSSQSVTGGTSGAPR